MYRNSVNYSSLCITTLSSLLVVSLYPQNKIHFLTTCNAVAINHIRDKLACMSLSLSTSRDDFDSV